MKHPYADRVLHNGIALPEEWPPKTVSPAEFTEIPVPYLGEAHPDVVNIDIGRQLFVDDFLIASTSLTHTPHAAVKHEANPLIRVPGYGMHLKQGASFYNAEKGVYELFWNGRGGLMYLASEDGINWDFEKARLVMTAEGGYGGYTSVAYNPTPDENNPRYLCLIRYANGSWEKILGPSKDHEHYHTDIYYSDDAETWHHLSGEGPTSGDATTMVYDPFRRTWVFSLRKAYPKITRARDYVECRDILRVKDFTTLDRVFWLRADEKDLHDELYPDFLPEIYCMSAVAYESIMLGAFQVFVGPANPIAHSTGIPKLTNICLGYSRDGFHYARPDREPIIKSTKTRGSWDRGYLHHANTVCVIAGDELRFYYGSYAGKEEEAPPKFVKNMMNDFGIGLATMRRDGFVSLDGTGEVVTRKIRFEKESDRLFINAKAKSLRAEILDADGNIIPGFSLDECVPFSGDATCAELKFKSTADLGALRGQDFSIRFAMEEGEFYAFWMSNTADGESGGFLAGGRDRG